MISPLKLSTGSCCSNTYLLTTKEWSETCNLSSQGVASPVQHGLLSNYNQACMEWNYLKNIFSYYLYKKKWRKGKLCHFPFKDIDSVTKLVCSCLIKTSAYSTFSCKSAFMFYFAWEYYQTGCINSTLTLLRNVLESWAWLADLRKF